MLRRVHACAQEGEGIDSDIAVTAGGTQGCSSDVTSCVTVTSRQRRQTASNWSFGDGSLLAANYSSTVLSNTTGTAGFTSSGSFRFYDNNWRGNQYIRTYSLSSLGSQLGVVGLGASFVLDAKALSKGEKSVGEVATGGVLGVAGLFSRFAGLVGLGYSFGEPFQNNVLNPIGVKLTESQSSIINNSNFQQ